MLIDMLMIVIMFLLGISIGSFLNVMADRIPAGKSIVSPPSHCFSCGHKLEYRDLIPLISYLALKGKCRYCKTPISARSFIVELTMGLLFVLIWLRFGVSCQLLTGILYCSLFMVLAITDLEQGVLPGAIIYPGIGLALLLSVGGSVFGYNPDIWNALAGLSLGFGFIFLIWFVPGLFGKKLLIFADVAMSGLVGTSLGFPLVVVALCLAIVVGGLITFILIVFKVKQSREAIPWGSFLAFSAVVTLLYGKEIWEWNYLFFTGLIKS